MCSYCLLSFKDILSDNQLYLIVIRCIVEMEEIHTFLYRIIYIIPFKYSNADFC